VLQLPYDDASFDAVVSNLPFGRQFQVDDPARWVRRALSQMARVTRPGGRVVVLVPPPVPRGLDGLRPTGSFPLRLLGVSTRIWAFDRTTARGDDRAERSRDPAAAHPRRRGSP